VIDPNKGTSQPVLDRLRDESYERTRLQIYEAIQKQLDDFEMTWDDLAEKLDWSVELRTLSPSGQVVQDWVIMSGEQVKQRIGCDPISLRNLNQIAHVFSAEAYMIFRPRYPWIPKT
jgi:hypothetical protein